MNTILLTLPRSGSHLAAQIFKCVPTFTLKDKMQWENEEVVAERIKWLKENIWFHYPYTEKVRQALQESQDNKYLLLRDPRAIIVSWAHYCGEIDSPLDFIYKDKLLHKYPFEERIDIITDYAHDLFFDYEKWRQSGMFIVLRYRDILFNPLARVEHEGFRLGVIDSYKEEMTKSQIKRSSKIYKDLIRLW